MGKAQSITLLDEILEQPAAFETLAHQLPKQLGRLVAPEKKHRRVIAIAEGSSHHAIAIAAPFIELWTGLPVTLYNPQDLEQKIIIAYQNKADNLKDCLNIYRDAFFLFISQSGETRSLIAVYEKLKLVLKNRLTGILVTNQQQSTLASMLNSTLALNVGKEASIAATKTLTASVYTLLWWGTAMAESRDTLPPEVIKRIRTRLKHFNQGMAPLCKPAFLQAVETFSQTLIKVNHFILLSRGPLELILPEAGLKLIETSNNIAYTDNTESFKHGPKVMLSGVRDVHPNTVYFIPRQEDLANAVFEDMYSHFTAKDGSLAYKTNRLFVLTFENNPALPDDLKKHLKIKEENILTIPPTESQLESLFMGLMTFQLISYYLAEAKGEDPDNPNLTKAVTE